jgi:hypothetical protein
MAIPTEFFCSLPFSTKRLSLRDKINFTVPHERFVRQRGDTIHYHYLFIILCDDKSDTFTFDYLQYIGGE